MDYTRIVLDKIYQFDPEYATKIVGYYLFKQNGEQEIARLAMCPDLQLREAAFVAKAALVARTEIQRLAAINPISPPPMAVNPISPPPMAVNPISPPPINPQQGLRQFPIRTPPPLSPSFQVPPTYWEPQSASNAIGNPEYMAMNHLDPFTELEKRTQLLSLENISTGPRRAVNDFNGLDVPAAVNFGEKPGRRFSNQPEFPLKVCYFFNKGYCKHGSDCRYAHAQVPIHPDMHGNDPNNEDQVVSPGSLAQLETEIVELLKQRSGDPLSIASLPMVYYDKYQKVLRAEGYLTESQRHGKSGYNLTKLLVRLNGIRVIDRPHGQHSVVLVEDAPKYVHKGDFAQNISALRQIYLTFPEDSTFTEEDVETYFNTFGTVEDVRIPSQQRRMFGFVTFVEPETVKMILGKGIPAHHFVGGSRVLVKPYKAKGNERRHQDSYEKNPRSLRRQLIEEQEREQERALEFQKRRLAQQQFTQTPFPIPPSYDFSMDDPRVSYGDQFNFQPLESPNPVPNERSRHTSPNSSDGYSNEERFNLPEDIY